MFFQLAYVFLGEQIRRTDNVVDPDLSKQGVWNLS